MTKSITATIEMSARMSLTVQASSRSWKNTVKEYLDPNETWNDQCDDVIEFYCEDEFAEEIKGEMEDALTSMQFEDIDLLKFGRLSVADIDCEEVSVYDNEEAE